MKRLVLLTLLCPLLGGCETVGWFWQAARGQWQLQRSARPVEAVLEDPSTNEELRERLLLIGTVAEFGGERLGLEKVGYRRYVELDREFVIWNVFATPELSLEARRWCFPIAGCVSYRGYFSERVARDYAGRLSRQGMDTWVGGVAAYSTLGWLQDPILSTWVWREAGSLAALVFHELAHRRLYVAGDTDFSESLASLLEEELLREWLSAAGADDEFRAYQARSATRSEFAALVACTWDGLGVLYRSAIPAASMRQRKNDLLQAFRDAHARLSPDWPEPARYQSWVEGPLNNARLLTVISYQRWVPALRALLKSEDGDVARFLARAETLAELDAEQRRQRLLRLAPQPGDQEPPDCGVGGTLWEISSSDSVSRAR